MKLADDLREFVESLNSSEVEYLIVGGHAVAFHSYPRYTGDIDIFIRRTPDNAAKVVAVLTAFGFGELGIDTDTLLEPDMIIQLGRPPNRIDILTQISGVDFQDAWSARDNASLDGIRYTSWAGRPCSRTSAPPVDRKTWWTCASLKAPIQPKSSAVQQAVAADGRRRRGCCSSV